MKIRVRNLPTRCTEEIESTYPPEGAPEGITIGRTYVEAEPADILDMAQQLRDQEPWFDFNSDREALYKQAMKSALAARERWARILEDAVKAVDTSFRAATDEEKLPRECVH